MCQKWSVQYWAIILILISDFILQESRAWQYGHEDNWPQLCKEGKKQSPIAVERKRALKKDYPPFIFTNYHKIYSTTLKNNGHSAEVRLKTDNPLTIQGGGLPEMYILDHLHFHWQSEHVVEGYRYPLELHLVHYAKSHGNLSTAVNHQKGVAVFSVLFDLSPDDDVEFSGLISLLDKLKENLNQPEPLDEFQVHDYLPRDTAGFFRYSGSLTTPGCNEGIIWTIFTNTIPISESQVNTFRSLKTDEHKELTKNYRSLQKLHGRNVYMKISPIHKSSGENLIRFSSILLVMSLLVALM